MRIRTLAVAAIAVPVLACAGARPAATAQAPAPTLHELALEVAHSSMTREQFDGMIATLSQSMYDAMARQRTSDGRKVPASLRRVIIDTFAEVLAYEDICALTADLYARHFSAEELREIGAHQRTATYRKQITLLPVFMQEGARWAQRTLAARNQEITVKIAARLQQNGESLQ
jgi:hypothetical protein